MSRLPLLLGVTGHRSIDPGDVDVATAAVDRLIAELAGRYQHTPLVLLSALAEGSDQLVARAAEADGVRVVCPVPIPVADYRLTFISESARSEFDRWLERVPHFVLAHRSVPDGHFRVLSNALAAFSHILVAVWDGVSGETPGGTADTVRMRLDAGQSARRSLDLVYHVRVRRAASAPRPRDTPREPAEFLTGRTASTELPAASARLFETLDRFNEASGTAGRSAPSLLQPFVDSSEWLDAALGGQPWR